MLYLVAQLRRIRRRTLRFQVEHERIVQWLSTVQQLAGDDPELALEVARSQRLIKGYGDTHARGWRSYQLLMAALPSLRAAGNGAGQMRELNRAALADDNGQALEQLLAALQGDSSRAGHIAKETT